MTEEEWLTTKGTRRMLGLVGQVASERKLRLLAAGCVRRAWHLLVEEGSRKAVEVAERFADGQATRRQLSCARARADDVWGHVAEARPRPLRKYNQVCAASDALSCADLDIRETVQDIFCPAIVGPCPPGAAHLFRCIFGNPFRPVTLDPAYRTPTVLALAEAAYQERLMPSGELEHARLAVLADALEEAGADAVLVAHLRSAGPHVRGCWGVDLVLGKG